MNLARLTDTPSVLPTALYVCCSLEGRVLDGWRRPDGSVEYLSHADLKRCIAGRNALAAKAVEELVHLLSLVPCVMCQSNFDSDCKIALCAELDECDLPIDSWLIESYADLVNHMASTGGSLCDQCSEYLRVCGEKRQKILWKALPEIFDVAVEGWGS